MEIYARQGDLVIRTTQVTGDLEPANNVVIAGGKSGAAHTIKGKARMRREGDRIFVVFDQEGKIVHQGRHKPTKMLAQGYVIEPLREEGNRRVED